MAPKRAATKNAGVVGPLDGMVFCVSGTFSLGQKQMQQLLKDHGASVASGLTKKVTHLLSEYDVNDPTGNNAPSAKVSEALANNVNVVNEAWLNAQIAAISATPSATPKRQKVTAATAPVAPSPANTSSAQKPTRGGKGKQTAASVAASFAPSPAKKASASTKSSVSTSTAAAPTNPGRVPGLVDPAFKIQNGTIIEDNLSGKALDVLLSFIEGTSDKYYLLQGIDVNGKLFVFTRWGRTGQAGQNQTHGPFDTFEAMLECFNDKLKDKTGNVWENIANGTFAKKAKKYDLLSQNTAQATAAAIASGVIWEYYVDDNVAGKSNGWYPYDQENLGTMESIWSAHAQNPNSNLGNRYVTSDSSSYTYAIDLRTMKQENTSTHKVRDIRRVTPTGVVTTASVTPSAVAVISATTTTTTTTTTTITKPTTKAVATKKATPKPAPTVTTTPATSIVIDPSYPNQNAIVHQDFDCMLNQVNIGQNNNKFYKIQLVQDKGSYILFTRWGRVGEVGSTQEKSFPNAAAGEAAFKAQFRAKTQNSWDTRDNFTKVSGKYMLMQVDNSAGAAAKASAVISKMEDSSMDVEHDDNDGTTKYKESDLPDETQNLIRLIFSEDMFNHAMAEMKIDTKRLPLGALTKAGIEAGMDALAELEEEIKKGAKNRNKIQELCSNFYTLIPHAFPRSQVPPLITTQEALQEKFDMLNVMLDIENAQGMVKSVPKVKKESKNSTDLKPNPLDEKYKTLHADLDLLDPKDKLYAIVSTYANQTMRRKVKLLNVWQVNRHGEDQRFKTYDFITNRRLLWHGTNCAVVASCLKGGLRIMPHSGGRVGKGIYLASEHGKSSAYTWPGKIGNKNVGLMFLAEAALGEEHHILRDDSSLRSAPANKHSIVALGEQEPDPKLDTVIQLDNKSVVVPQGKPVSMTRGKGSNFDQSEYLLYDEAQHRIRFVCAFEF